MIYKILHLGPKWRAHLSTCVLVLALSYSFLMYHSYETGIAVSQGSIILWSGQKEKQHHEISLKIYVSNMSPRCLVPWESQTGRSPPQGSHIVFALHDFCSLRALPMKVSSFFSRTCSFALLIPSWLAYWEALHRDRAVAKQAFVFRGTVIPELLLFPILETIN